MSTNSPVLTAAFWRTRRAAAVAGIIFGVLLLTAMALARVAMSDTGYETLLADGDRRELIRLSLQLVPFAGMAFLWFIGVIREQLGAVEDRLFSTVFMGSGLLFLALLFSGAAISSSLILMLEQPSSSAEIWAYGRNTSQGLISVYAMRMAAVFTISVSTAGLRAAALPRWVSYLGYLVAVLLLVGSADQQWLQLAFPAWVLLVSTAILVTHPRERAARDAMGGA